MVLLGIGIFGMLINGWHSWINKLSSLRAPTTFYPISVFQSLEVWEVTPFAATVFKSPTPWFKIRAVQMNQDPYEIQTLGHVPLFCTHCYVLESKDIESFISILPLYTHNNNHQMHWEKLTQDSCGICSST